MFDRLIQRLGRGRSEATVGTPASVANGQEARWLRAAAEMTLSEAPEPHPRALDPDTDIESYAETAVEALADKDAEGLAARAIKRAKRHRVKAAKLSPRASMEAQALEADRVVLGIVTGVRLLVEQAVGSRAYRSISDRVFSRWERVFMVAEAIGLTLLFSVLFDLSPLYAFLWGGAIAVGMIAGPVALSEELKRTLQRRGLAEQERGGQLPEMGAYLARELPTRWWLPATWILSTLTFLVGGIMVGVLRSQESTGSSNAAPLALLTLMPMVAAAVMAWAHANLLADAVDHWQSRQHQAARTKSARTTRHLSRYLAHVEAVAVLMEAADRRANARRHMAEAEGATHRLNNPTAFGHGRRLLSMAAEGSQPSRPTHEGFTVFVPESETMAESVASENGEVAR